MFQLPACKVNVSALTGGRRGRIGARDRRNARSFEYHRMADESLLSSFISKSVLSIREGYEDEGDEEGGREGHGRCASF